MKETDLEEGIVEKNWRSAEAWLHKGKFTPSPGKEVRFVDESGKVIETRNMNRAERRRLKLYNKKAIEGGEKP